MADAPAGAADPAAAAHPGEFPPRQERSRRTRRNLLDAAARLVAEEGVDGATVADIAREAGTSVGNVYRRFPSKEALVRALEQAFLAGRHEWWDAMLAEERWAGRELADLIRTVVAEILDRHRRHRGLLRAVAARARDEYEDRVPPVGEGPGRRLTKLVLALWPEEVRHPDPRRAVPLAFEMVAATAGELILFRRGGPEALGLDDDTLGRELTRTVLAYLGADASSTGADP